MRALSSSATAVFSAALTLGASFPATAAWRTDTSSPRPYASIQPQDSAPSAGGTVLGLDGADEATAAALTKALRKAFAKRGLSGGEELSLFEMRLTMGCENDEPECLAKAGRSLGIKQLTYGYLRTANRDFSLELIVVDVERGSIEAQVTQEVSKLDLAPERIDATAEDIVRSLFAEEEDPVPPPPPVAGAQEAPPDAQETRSSGRLVWGRHRNQPRWKWIGLGISAGLTVAGIATTAGLGYVISPNGPLSDDLDEAVANSQGQENQIPPPDEPTTQEVDYCEIARRNPTGDPQFVYNAEVTKVCNRADGFELGWAVSLGVTIAASVSTIVFTTLLFVQRDKPGTDALLKHRPRFSVGPTRDGGFIVGGGFDF